MKPVRVRPQADTEMDALADYIARDNLNAALRFLEVIQKSFDLISEQPEIGSRRYAYLPLMEGLRMWPVADFEKHLIFYIERPTYIDVLRALHSARDLPEALTEAT
jgi:toxin ParE1/3/4